MSMPADGNSVRLFAAEVLRHLGEAVVDSQTMESHLDPFVRDLVRRPDLLTLGVPREGNHVRESQYLYYDPGLAVTISHQANGVAIPAHDHGVWEMLAVYRGKIAHTRYRVFGDGLNPLNVTLDVIDERILGPGDAVLVMPPDDIHAFTALAEDTYHLAVVGGRYNPVRHYYQPDQGSFLARSEIAWRRR
jgi:predicted metal-dependent enzyme (double-stranded beta helix superfamily)